MASSLRRPARVCSFLSLLRTRRSRPRDRKNPPPREFHVRGARLCNLLSSAGAHCWQWFLTTRRPAVANFCEFLMY